MSYEDYKAALADLAKDSVAWSDLSATFETVVSTIESCALARYQMDGVGHMIGAEDNYNSAHGTIHGLAAAAPDVFQQISTKLAETKKRYEEADGYAQWQLDRG